MRRTVLLVALLASGPALAAPAPVADGYVRRLEALAELETLNAELLSHDSATAVLQAWCDAHGPGGGARITAERVHGPDRPPSEAAKAALGLGPQDAVRYRRVRLACAGHVLSQADNWYLPARLTPQMNQILDSGDTPFGVVARPLDFRRRNLGARLLYQPLAPGWEHSGRRAPAPEIAPREVLQQSAVLSTPDGAPLAYVVETYTDETLTIALRP